MFYIETGSDSASGSITRSIVGEELKQYADTWTEQRKCFYSLDHKGLTENGQEKENCRLEDEEFDLELERALELP